MSVDQFPSHWKILPLTESVDALIDYRGKTPTKTESGIPLITAKIVKGGTILPVTEFIAEEDYESWMVRGLPQAGDIVVTTEAPLGEVAQLTDSNVALAQRIVTLRGAEGLLSNDYLRYVMQGAYVQEQLEARASGSTVKGIKQSELRKILIPIPPLSEQSIISVHLKSIENKIQLNQQINETLEQIAQAIFKSWFVDFEPTRAKIIAKEQGADSATQELAAQAIICGAITLEQLQGYAEESVEESAQQREQESLSTRLQKAINEKLSQASAHPLNATTAEQLIATAALFPNEIVESELGEVPEGWSASTLSEHFNIVMGQSPKGDTYNEEGNGMLFFQGRRDFGFRYPEPRVYTTEPKRIAQAGDTLISVRAPVGDRNMAEQECCLGRGVAGIRHKSGARSFTYAFIGHIEKNLGDSGSDGTVFSSINKNELSRVGFVAPNDTVLEAYEGVVYSIDQQVEVLSKETKTLENIRDALLPKLLSGEITLAEEVKRS